MLTALPKANSLNAQVAFLLMDGVERSPREICLDLNRDLATAITARIRDLRKPENGGFDVPRIPRKINDRVVNFYTLSANDSDLFTLKVYRIVAKHPGLTLYELAQLLDSDVERTAQSLFSVENLNRIKQNAGRKCSVMKRLETTWSAL